MIYKKDDSISDKFAWNRLPVLRARVLRRSANNRRGFGLAAPLVGAGDRFGRGSHATDKFDFAPTAGEFTGARTFGQQAKHLAAVIYGFSAGVLGEKAPADTGKLNEGPVSLRTKAEIVAYVKDAFAYGHKAMLSLNEKNELRNAERGSQATPLYEATFLMSHSMDHYGQMVEYLQMNGIVPPASRPRGK